VSRNRLDSWVSLDARIHDAMLRDAGVIEPDEPTEVSHALWMERYDREARGDFTPAEREKIRAFLGLGPFGERADA
jgi:hypothetical protein